LSTSPAGCATTSAYRNRSGRGLQGDGCEAAAIALAIVSAKPAGHFTSSPGGCFYGMVAKAKASELNLTHTIWGFRTGS